MPFFRCLPPSSASLLALRAAGSCSAASQAFFRFAPKISLRFLLVAFPNQKSDTMPVAQLILTPFGLRLSLFLEMLLLREPLFRFAPQSLPSRLWIALNLPQHRTMPRKAQVRDGAIAKIQMDFWFAIATKYKRGLAPYSTSSTLSNSFPNPSPTARHPPYALPVSFPTALTHNRSETFPHPKIYFKYFSL